MKNKLKIIIPIVIAVIAIIIAALCINFTPQERADVSSLISTAQKYLIENQYEQAIAEFNKVIELEPMNVDACIGLAEAYVAMDDTDKTIEVLEKGYEITGDERLKEMLDRLLTPVPEKAVVTTTATTTTIETTAEPKFEEEVKNKALAVIEKFDVYKKTGNPNSVVYYYLPEKSYLPEKHEPWETGSLTKCIYSSSGELITSYETLYYADTGNCAGEIIVNNWAENTAEFYAFFEVSSGSSANGAFEKMCYKKCFLNTGYIMSSLAFVGLDYSTFDGLMDNCYTYSSDNSQITITVDDKNEPINIMATSDYTTTEFSLNGSDWVGNYSFNDFSIDFFPCENTLPAGAFEEDFEITLVDSDDCKVFYNWEEYNAYKWQTE